MPLTREERRLAWESMGLYKGPGNYRYGYSDARTGLTYGYPGVRRNSTDDVRKQLENKKGLTKHWMIGQLLLWGATEQKGLEKTRKDEVLGLVWDALNSGKFEHISADMIAFERSMRFEHDGEDIDPSLPDDRLSERNTWTGAFSTPASGGRIEGYQEQNMRERAARRWEKLMDEHRKYTRSRALKPVLGSYAIDCPVIEERWPQFSAELTLDISEHELLGVVGLQACVNFGAMKGTMLLVPNAKDLIRCDDRMNYPQDSDNDDGSDGWAAEGQEIADDEPVRRVRGLLHCQSHVKMDGATYVSNSWLSFNEDTCLTFKGHVRLPVGDDGEVEFKGFKIRDAGFGIPRPWTSYRGVTMTYL